MPEPPSTPSTADLAFVCWQGRDGLRTTSSPLERDRAEALVRAYSAAFPKESCWVEPVPWCAPRPRIPRLLPR